MMKKRIALLITLFALLLGSGGAYAQPDVPPPWPIPIPPPPRPDAGLRIAYQRVDVTINNQVATTRIDQLFVNESDWLVEGTYFFPLPPGAVVSQLTMWVDGQPIEAKILEREEARQIYDDIVRQLRDPALLEYVGAGAIQANVFPIPPRDERRIEIEYSQVLTAVNGLFHYVYPQSSKLYTNLPLDTQSIRVAVQSNEAIRAIYSPSHPVAISREGEFRAVAGFEGSKVVADQDFELYYSVSPEEIGLNLLSYRETGQDGFFLLLVAPGVTSDEVVAKDVILVLDTSGSMEGEKMAQAKEAARYVIEHLQPDDRFNIVSFSTGVRSYQPGLVTAAEPGNYAAYINSLEALGGTNISLALLEAAAQVDRERPTTLIFLTDGLATEGITDTSRLLSAVGEALPGNARLFAFGVGDDVDPNLLDALAENHRGLTTYVRPFQAIDEAVSGFYAKISAPVLTDVALDFGGVIVEQLYPATLPDLFAGTQLALVGRYREGGLATITLSGEVNGRSQTFRYEDNQFQTAGGEAFIPRLWATRAIGHLLREIRLHGDNPELIQSIVNLSIRYGIITPYTSYLIEEDDIFSQTRREALGAGVANEAAAPRSVTDMVEEAAASADMAAAEAPIALPTMVASAPGSGQPAPLTEQVRLVGSKTFVLRDGVWLDTAYDADRHTPQPVGFASDAYFDLLAARPEVGHYLALGPRVLLVVDDQAYEVVAEGEGVEAVVLPVERGGEGETAVPPIPAPNTPEPVAEPAPARPGVCASLIILPLFVGLGWFGRRAGQKKPGRPG